MQRQSKLGTFWRGIVALLFLAIALLPPAQPVYAQEPGVASPTPQPHYAVTDTPEGATIRWTTAGVTTLDAVRSVLPASELQGFTLPIETFAFRVTGGAGAGELQIRQLQSVDLPEGSIAPNPPAEPLAIDAATVLQPLNEPPQLPLAPALILSSGTVNGEWIVVVGLSPVYAENGVVKLATALEVLVTGAVQALSVEEQAMQAAAVTGAEAEAFSIAPELSLDPAMAAAPDALDNPDVSSAFVKLSIAAPGIQRVPLASLTAANAAWTASALNNARLTLNGALVPVQVTASELRFYAPLVGDRWNTTSSYILSIETDAAKRSPKLATRALTVPVAAADAAEIDASSTALDKSVWTLNKVYDAMDPGDPADHYFAAKLSRRKLEDPPQDFSTDLVTPAALRPANQLPIVSGTQVYTLNVVRVVAESYGPNLPLKVTVSGGAVAAKAASKDVNVLGSAKVPFSFASTDARNIKVTLNTGTDARALVLDSIAFSRKVRLDLGGRGAVFAGEATQKTYRWSGVPKIGSAIVLWDVTNPAVPIALTGSGDIGFVDTQAARSYAVAGEGHSHTPALSAYRPLAGSSTEVPPSHAIYIIPNESYRAALQPLIDFRKTQNCRPNVKCVLSVVDATRIYDRYGGGNVSPEAIRLFLRDAFVRFASQPSGSPRLLAVTVVGDGSWDPKNFEAKQSSAALIPPYMVERLDPSFGEAPCERCYAQYLGYNGVLCANPHTCDDKDGLPRAFSPEVSIGRLPIKNVGELQGYVGKLVGYETTTESNSAWRGRVVYIADNYMKGESGGTPVPDGAGDFAATLDKIRALHPNANSPYSAARVYYDPFPGAQTPSKYGQPWRFSNPKGAWEQVIANLNEGASHVVYYGHATPWTMARYDLPNAWRFALIETTDSDYVFNSKRLYVQLSATCLAGQFARPADTGMSIDEQFMLDNNGGSVASWGPAGYGIPTAHDRLLKGYFTKLFSTTATQTLRELTDAGYLELSYNTLGHYDMLRTFNLLGDPLTRIRRGPALYPNYMPVLRRGGR